MSRCSGFLGAFLPLLLALAGTLPGVPVVAQPVDPNVVGERLQRLTAAVESLELTLASQKRQIEALSAEVQQLRSTSQRSGERPWADDLKRVADAVSEVDRKRAADGEQVLKVLNELRKAIASAAETSRPAPAAAARGGDGSRRGARATEANADRKELTYTMKRGDSLSGVLAGFNADAQKEGYQTLTVQEVMAYNAIEDDRKVPEGAVIRLPVSPKEGR